MKQVWRINLLGILIVEGNEQQISRFRTQKTGALLGYLAYEPRPQSREVLSTLLWPEADAHNGRNSLSVALSSLRTQLEPPGIEFGSILVADRNLVSLNTDAISTDIAEFRAVLDTIRSNGKNALEHIPDLQRAVELYRGRLLEGLYEDWIVEANQRLEEQFFSLLDHLTSLLYTVGHYLAMQSYAERGVALAPWREASHHDLIRALAAQGQGQSALRHYRRWRKQADHQSEPLSPTTAAIIAQIERDMHGSSLIVSANEVRSKPIDTHGTTKLNGDDTANSPHKTPLTTEDERETRPVGRTSALPIRRTRFFGRRAQLQRLNNHLLPSSTGDAITETDTPTERLVTLTGLGGSGKTRLAIEAASQLLHRYGGRLWFITLANLLSPALLDIALRDALQIIPDPQALPLEQIVEYLSGAPSLLVLDNFEGLLPAGAVWITMLLERLPSLSCLVTSRQRLDIEGEKEVVVRPLPVPRQSAPLHVEQLLRFAGVQLFVDRSRAARPDFGLTRRNADAVRQLCHDLEGIPLAIELLAARASALSPAQMVEHWENRAELLRSTRRDLPPRHRSMQAVIETSYSLLPDEIQQFFRRQWVFRDGWTPEAAAFVCEEPRALHFATQLRACSLLYQQERVDTVRFSSLETLRDFAGDQLTPAERDAIRERHAHYFLSQVECDSSPYTPVYQPRQLARFLADLSNYRTALEWCESSQPLLALRLAAALWPWWEGVSNLEEGRAYLERALQAVPNAPPALRAQAYLGAGRLAYHQSFDLARPLLEEALALYRQLDDGIGIAATLCPLSLVMMNLNDARCQKYAQEAFDLARQSSTVAIEAQAAYSLGVMALGWGDMEGARRTVEVCVAFYRQAGNQRGLTEALDVLGMALWALEEWEQSGAIFEEALRLAHELHWPFMESHTLWGISAVARAQGNLPRALEAARESAHLTLKGRFLWFGPYVIANLAHAKLDNGETKGAVILLGAADALHEALSMPLVPLFFAVYERYLERAREAFDPDQFASLWEQGRTLSFEAAIELGLQKG